MIKISSITKEYSGQIVLNIPELFIPRAECFGLVGNNGAGKTTLFRIILDLIRPTSGHVFIEGEDVSATEEWKKRVGSYLDEHMLLGYLTPDEYFESLSKIYGLSVKDMDIHLDRFSDLFNNEIIGTNKYIRDLSKGNIKKVGIAAAMFGQPEVVILDEPFENLDPSSQNRLKKIIGEEIENSQTTFLISSHDLSHVTDICRRIVLLEKGIIVQDLKESREDMIQALNQYFDA
ncbi:MAG: ABC transporter ATP-binding protein [Balneolaceae bacterium]|nr:ABC transporter ATP-binding protein [Balneolaceae bacterium]